MGTVSYELLGKNCDYSHLAARFLSAILPAGNNCVGSSRPKCPVGLPGSRMLTNHADIMSAQQRNLTQ